MGWTFRGYDPGMGRERPCNIYYLRNPITGRLEGYFRTRPWETVDSGELYEQEHAKEHPLIRLRMEIESWCKGALKAA